MSVSSVRLIGERRSGEKGTNFVRTYTKVWRVETTDPLDGPAVAMTASGIATQLVTTYASGNDSDSAALCISVSAEEDGDSRIAWIVTEQYSTAPPGTPEALSNPNPFLDAPTFALGFDQFESDVTKDIDGETCTTAAGQPYDGLRRDDSRPVFIVRRNESSINLPLIMYAKDAVNATTWRGCSPRTVKVKSITTGEIQRRNQFTFYNTTYEFHLNPDTWDLKPLNWGTWAYNDDTGALMKGFPYPVRLDADGFQLADGSEATYQTFRVYPELDFNIFGF